MARRHAHRLFPLQRGVRPARARRARRAAPRQAASAACGSPTTTTPGTTSRATARSCGRVIGAIAAGDRALHVDHRRDLPDDPHPSRGDRPGRRHLAGAARGALHASASAAARRSTSTSSATRWPEADERLEMLEEAIEVIRALWQGGDAEPPRPPLPVENARIYDLPDEPPPILVSGLRPEAIDARRAHRRRLLHDVARRRRRRALPREAAAGAVQAGTKVCCGRRRGGGAPDRAPAVAQRGAARRARADAARRPRTSSRPRELVTRGDDRRVRPVRARPRRARRGDPGVRRRGLRRALRPADRPATRTRSSTSTRARCCRAFH